MKLLIEDEQREWCAARGVPYFGLDLSKKIGISRELLENPRAAAPLQGIRHTPSATTTGWFLWSGENDGSPDFFVPLHAEHLVDRHRHLLPLLGGAPGGCLLMAPDHDNYEDVWLDPGIAAVVG